MTAQRPAQTALTATTGTELRERLAEVVAAHERIPRVAELLTAAFGEHSFCWDAANRADMTTKVLVAGLQLEVEELRQLLSEIATKYEVACAAEKNWRRMLQARQSWIFRNDAGEIAKMPVSLVDVIARKASFDGEVVPREETIAFMQGEAVIAEIPKTLFVCLERILESSSWGGRRQSPSQDSQLRDAFGPTQRRRSSRPPAKPEKGAAAGS